MTERCKLLIIDDDKTWQAFLSVALQEQYNVISALDGDIGLKLAAEWMPDTILLDIEMPVKNGYDVCSALKSNPVLQDIPVIFLSSKASTQEKITGFQLGADDYLVKPCAAELLQLRVERSISRYRDKKLLDEKASSAQVLAFEAMNSSADLGNALRFAERTYAMYSFDKLAEGLFQTMTEFGLDTSVMFITSTGPLFYAQNKHELSPLEKDMFLTIHQEGRFCDFGCRTFCNFDVVSLLIKNMPLSSPERYGRIKDTVPWILGATDGKVGALDVYASMLEGHQDTASRVQALHATLSDLLQSKAMDNQLKAVIGNALIQVDELLTKQAQVNEIVKADESRKHAMGLGSDEIFSNDMDFF
jgi:DNA-binding response OmpR family regulator